MTEAILWILMIVLAFAAALLYMRVAIRYNILDNPNFRSSHTLPTIRGGGILFPLLLLPCLALASSTALYTALSLLLIAIISFWDDISPRTARQRFSIHILVAVLWAVILYDVLPLWSLPFIIIGFIAFFNAYNFMDGINGITVLYTAAVWGLLRIFENDWLLQEWGVYTVAAMDAAILVFAFFNVRKKARWFAGDVGALSIATFIGINILLLIARDKSVMWLSLVVLYGIDSGLTITKRLFQGEKIWEPHCKHLYQYLVHKAGWSHLQVASLYAVLQFSIGFIAIRTAVTFSSTVTFLLIVAACAITYLLLHAHLSKK